MSVLDISGLDVDLGGRRVLTGVDLTVDTGELVALLGPNGAGKTTLLRAVLGLLPARAGVVSVGGRPIRSARSVIGYVPQRHDFAWDFPVSVEDAVLTGRIRHIGWLRLAGARDVKAVGAALERVGLHGLRDRPVGELSGGQRQRVLVARALARDPRLLLLDEPFTGLDLPTQDLLTTLFADLAREGRAVLMTTHDLASAALTASRICLLNGKVIADGAPTELGDADVWARAFGVRSDSPSLRALLLTLGGTGVAAC